MSTRPLTNQVEPQRRVRPQASHGQALVIHLPRRTDRRQHVQQTLRMHGIEPVFLPAIDGTSLSAADRLRLAGSSDFARGAEPGELGCFLSHRRAWEAAVESDADHTLVCEDDVVLSPSASDLLRQLDWIPTGTDLVKLDCYPGMTTLGRACAQLRGDRALHPLLASHYASAAYVVSRTGAQRLIDASRTLTCPIDHFLFRPRSAGRPELRVMQIYPAIATQLCLRSPCESERTAAGRSDIRGSLHGRLLLRPWRRLRYAAYHPVRAAGRLIRRWAFPRWWPTLRTRVPYR